MEDVFINKEGQILRGDDATEQMIVHDMVEIIRDSGLEERLKASLAKPESPPVEDSKSTDIESSSTLTRDIIKKAGPLHQLKLKTKDMIPKVSMSAEGAKVSVKKVSCSTINGKMDAEIDISAKGASVKAACASANVIEYDIGLDTGVSINAATVKAMTASVKAASVSVGASATATAKGLDAKVCNLSATGANLAAQVSATATAKGVDMKAVNVDITGVDCSAEVEAVAAVKGADIKVGNAKISGCQVTAKAEAQATATGLDVDAASAKVVMDKVHRGAGASVEAKGLEVKAATANIVRKEDKHEVTCSMKAVGSEVKAANLNYVGEKTGASAKATVKAQGADLQAANVNIAGKDSSVGAQATLDISAASARVANVNLNPQGGTQFQAKADITTGVDAFNVNMGSQKGGGIGISTRAQFGNVNFSLGPPNLILGPGCNLGLGGSSSSSGGAKQGSSSRGQAGGSSSSSGGAKQGSSSRGQAGGSSGSDYTTDEGLREPAGNRKSVSSERQSKSGNKEHSTTVRTFGECHESESFGSSNGKGYKSTTGGHGLHGQRGKSSDTSGHYTTDRTMKEHVHGKQSSIGHVPTLRRENSKVRPQAVNDDENSDNMHTKGSGQSTQHAGRPDTRYSSEYARRGVERNNLRRRVTQHGNDQGAATGGRKLVNDHESGYTGCRLVQHAHTVSNNLGESNLGQPVIGSNQPAFKTRLRKPVTDHNHKETKHQGRNPMSQPRHNHTRNHNITTAKRTKHDIEDTPQRMGNGASNVHHRQSEGKGKHNIETTKQNDQGHTIRRSFGHQKTDKSHSDQENEHNSGRGLPLPNNQPTTEVSQQSVWRVHQTKTTTHVTQTDQTSKERSSTVFGPESESNRKSKHATNQSSPALKSAISHKSSTHHSDGQPGKGYAWQTPSSDKESPKLADKGYTEKLAASLSDKVMPLKPEKFMEKDKSKSVKREIPKTREEAKHQLKRSLKTFKQEIEECDAQKERLSSTTSGASAKGIESGVEEKHNNKPKTKPFGSKGNIHTLSCYQDESSKQVTSIHGKVHGFKDP